MHVITCSKVDNDIDEKNGIRETVEDDPSGRQVVVEE